MNTTNQPRILTIARKNSVTSHSPVPNRLRTLSVIDTGRNKGKNTSYTASLSKFIRSTTLTLNFLPIISPTKLNYKNLYHLRYFDDSAISRQLNKMGYKRIAGSPSREIKQHTLQSLWKRQNQTTSPAGLRPFAKAVANTDDQSSQDSSGSISDTSFDPDRHDTTPAKLEEDNTSMDSNATETIENLRLTSSEQESSTDSTSGSATTNYTLSLADFPSLPSKKISHPPSTPVKTIATLNQQPTTLSKVASPKEAITQEDKSTTPIPRHSSDPRHTVKNHAPGTESLKLNPATQYNDKKKISTNPLVSPTLTPAPIAATHTPQTATTQVQYNPYLRMTHKHSTMAPLRSTDAMALDKEINLKRRAQRTHIHRYDLRLKIKVAITEAEEFPILQKALQIFMDIVLQVDSSTIFPPYFELDRNDKIILDLTEKFKSLDLDSTPS